MNRCTRDKTVFPDFVRDVDVTVHPFKEILRDLQMILLHSQMERCGFKLQNQEKKKRKKEKEVKNEAEII